MKPEPGKPDASDRSDGSVGSDGSDGSDAPAAGGSRPPARSHLRPSGGYRGLRSFQAATIIYDATAAFCERFLDKRSRTVDQMVQAARSGRQNIAEGSRASAISSQTELRLVSIARASLDELLLDYEDFLRQRGKPLWAKDDLEAQAVRTVGTRKQPPARPGGAASVDQRDQADRTDQTDRSDRSDAPGPRDAPRPALSTADYSRWLSSPDPAVVANAIICLIHQANYLLDRQIAALEQQFIREGGYSERLAASRLAERARQQQAAKAASPDQPNWADGADRTDRSDRSDQSDPPAPPHSPAPAHPPAPPRAPRPLQHPSPAPACPLCGQPMAVRTARQGDRAGSQFWGCSAYPECKGTRRL